MSFFGKVFGSGKKGEKAPTTGEAIQKLRETEEMLIKKQEFLEKKIEQVWFKAEIQSLVFVFRPMFFQVVKRSSSLFITDSLNGTSFPEIRGRAYLIYHWHHGVFSSW